MCDTHMTLICSLKTPITPFVLSEYVAVMHFPPSSKMAKYFSTSYHLPKYWKWIIQSPHDFRVNMDVHSAMTRKNNFLFSRDSFAHVVQIRSMANSHNQHYYRYVNLFQIWSSWKNSLSMVQNFASERRLDISPKMALALPPTKSIPILSTVASSFSVKKWIFPY